MRRASLTALLAVASFLPGCALLGPKVEISRRYDALSPAGAVIDCAAQGADTSHCYDASVSALALPGGSSGLPVTALSDRAQAAYVAALAEKSPSVEALKAALAAPAKVKDASGDYANATQLDLRFVVGLFPTNGYIGAADRLDWADVRIEVQAASGSTARFVSWSQAANRVAAISVGSVTNSRSETISPEAGLGIGAASAKIGAEFKASREERADITDQASINATIRDGAAHIIQRGGWRLDLTGNATFDAAIQLPPDATMAYIFTKPSSLVGKGGDGDWMPADKVHVGLIQLRAPKPEPLCATVRLDFVARQVIAGDRTFTESDDRVVPVRGFSSALQRIAPPVVVEQWKLISPGGIPLQFAGDGVAGIVQFPGKQDALDFLHWLSAVNPPGGRVANGRFFFKHKQPLDMRQYPGLDPSYPNADKDWAAANAPCGKAGTSAAGS